MEADSEYITHSPGPQGRQCGGLGTYLELRLHLLGLRLVIRHDGHRADALPVPAQCVKQLSATVNGPNLQTPFAQRAL